MIDCEQTQRDKRESAYHEAAHALFALRHDWAVASVRIWPTGEGSIETKAYIGRTEYSDRSRFEPSEASTRVGRAFLHGMMSLAGDVSRWAWDGETDLDDLDPEWQLLDDLQGTDCERLQESLEAVGCEAEESGLPAVWVRLTWAFLRATRPALDALAAALMEREELTGVEAWEIIGEGVDE